MKRLIATLLLTSLIGHLFYSSGYLIDYYLNTDFYKEHCINQDRPLLNCDGKCILAQKINKKRNQEEPPTIISVSFEYLSVNENVTFENQYQFSNTQFEWSNFYHNPNAQNLLKPPG